MLYRPEQVAEGQRSPRLEREEGRKRKRGEEDEVTRKKAASGSEECGEVRMEFVLCIMYPCCLILTFVPVFFTSANKFLM